MEILFLIIGIVVGGLVSWFISHWYYVKSSRDSNDSLDGLSEKFESLNTLARFENLLVNSEWRSENINHTQVWVCQNDTTFQIVLGEYDGEFREPWVSVYPNSVGGRIKVYLKIGSSVIKELLFISADGGRIFVPLPDRDFKEDKIYYYWQKNSLPWRVCNIIGEYYIYNDIFGVAERSSIEIKEVPNN